MKRKFFFLYFKHRRDLTTKVFLCFPKGEVSNFSSFPPSLCRSRPAMKVKMSCAQLSYCSENNCRSSLSHLRLAKHDDEIILNVQRLSEFGGNKRPRISPNSHTEKSFNFFIVRRVSAFFSSLSHSHHHVGSTCCVTDSRLAHTWGGRKKFRKKFRGFLSRS